MDHGEQRQQDSESRRPRGSHRQPVGKAAGGPGPGPGDPLATALPCRGTEGWPACACSRRARSPGDILDSSRGAVGWA